ncbi:YceI family protein [Paeniglutamicibacter psychrophenolicus]|uniref:YceI family protein n=1 Tax=Paeniglutamicibacter psychrophenolicus TaxID=257454 RepID=UPI002785063E|nr:YceI family protein [Paeniglutamicibacter psychrophenolicus]MDQ0095273.1 polyisoprenoid-binding protein YceI [Paeniglutamicibacter psychrophenolicus]
MTQLDPAYAGTWRFDPGHTRIGFNARHAMVTKVRGAFNEVEGTVHIDAEDMGKCSVEMTVKVASVDTRNADRDQHLRTNDFFDAPKYPNIVFRSTRIDQVDENSFIVNGELTIKETTREIAVPLEFTGVETDPFGNLRAGFEGSRRIDRREYGVSWNKALDSGGVLVSERVLLEFEISAIKDAKGGAGAA